MDVGFTVMMVEGQEEVERGWESRSRLWNKCVSVKQLWLGMVSVEEAE